MRRLVPLVLAACAAAAAAPSAQAAGDQVPGELIVRYRAGVTAEQRADAARDRGARVARALAVPGASLVRIDPSADSDRAAAALERDPRVEWAEPNVYREAASLPNDPMLGEQWALHAIGAPEAWDRTGGAPGVRVAIVDSGVNLDHPDLAPSIATNPGESGGGRESNGVDDDGNGFVDDWRGWDFVQRDNDPSDNHGHGSIVAGITAAHGDDGVGMAGVAWRAGIVPVRVLGNLKSGTCAEVSSGLAYAARAGARVVNTSIGSDTACQLEYDAIASAPETLFVFAAMNDGEDADAQPVYPCNHPLPNIVCVAATDRDGELAGFSNYGAKNVDLAAPGTDVLGAYMKFEERETIFSDGFETPIFGRWATGGVIDTWERSFLPRTGTYALSDSPTTQYANNDNTFARLAGGLDMTNRRDCAMEFWVRWALGPHDATPEPDTLLVEVSRDGVTWEAHQGLSGTSLTYGQHVLDLARLEGHPAANVRFHLVANGSGTANGVDIDDVEIVCVPPVTEYTGAPDEYVHDDGTSYAAPQVAGVAALVLSLEPSLPVAELKRRLLESVDPLPSLAGRTVTGGRLNAARAIATSAPPPPPSGPAAPPVGSAGGGAPPLAVPRQVLKCPKRGAARGVCRRLARRIAACGRKPAARRPACIARALKRARKGCRSRRTPRRVRACARTLSRARLVTVAAP